MYSSSSKGAHTNGGIIDDALPPELKARVFADIFSPEFQRSLNWQPFRKGIEICRLYEQPGGASSAFLRYAPGARLARHEHRGFEHIFILSGSQIDDHGQHDVGAMLVHSPGTSHTVSSDVGCVVLAIWEKPVLFLPD